MVGFNAILLVAIVTLLILAVLKVAAPHIYDRYVLRDTTRPTPSRSSRAVALVILAGMVLFAVRFGLNLLHGSRPVSEMPAHVTPRGAEMGIGAWIGLLCVSGTGIALSLFPVAVITRLSQERIVLTPADEVATRKIKAIGRVLGVLFLIGAILIARQLL